MQAYSNPKRESDPHALPDVEVWQSFYSGCPECGGTVIVDKPVGVACPECYRVFKMDDPKRGWFYWFCFPGCLPDSDPFGPFDTREEALADAQQGAEEEEL